jgi:hypothetical protein
MSSRVLPPLDGADQRRIRRSRVLSFVLVLVAAIVLSLRPDVFGDPQTQPAHTLLHVWRIVAGLVLAAAALGVQVAVALRWRAAITGQAAPEHAPGTPADTPSATPREAPGNRAPRDR